MVRGPRYGVDAPPFPALLAAAGIGTAVVASRRRPLRVPLSIASATLLGSSASYLYTTLHGKLRVWDRVLDDVGLEGGERSLDLGCGRGMVLIKTAQRLPAGQAVGIDLWTADQSGNSAEVTLANAAAAGVADRVEVRTGDMTALPFDDASFDVVTSALAIHNIRPHDQQLRAVDEAMRVLRPGGKLIIADIWTNAKAYADHLGMGTLTGLGPQYWYGGPWVRVSLLQVTKSD